MDSKLTPGLTPPKREPRYSGPNRSGVCICGHSWQDHHLSMVMRQEYAEETGEGYIPDECCHYGSNEVGGMQCVDGEWIDHCHGYGDSKAEAASPR